MSKLNVDFLIDSPVERLVENIDSIFTKVVQEIESYLDLGPVDKTFKITLVNGESSDSELKTNVFSIGARRFHKNNVLNIHISRDYTRFIPIIVLREAYKCFVPRIDANIKTIDIFIGQKVAIDLKKLSSMEQWDSIITDILVDYEFLSEEYDRLEDFLKRESTEGFDSPFQFFFKYVRSYPKIVKEQQEGFYDVIYEKYALYSSKSLYNDEVIETIRVLKKIFYRVQHYAAMVDYQRYFTTFKENGFIKTNLSLHKFTENMLWIKNYSQTLITDYIYVFSTESSDNINIEYINYLEERIFHI